MLYDFQSLPDRRRAYSIKWNIGEEELPMFIADMDFKSAPAVCRAIRSKASLEAYGYHFVPPVFFEALADWFARRHHAAVKPEEILYCEGVMPAIGSVLRHLTAPGDKVVALSPVYHHFYSAVRDNRRELVLCPLLYDADSKDYRIDVQALQAVLSDPKVKVLLFCNPHNPTGRVWDRETLSHLGSLCAKNDVFVVSDEIHADLTDSGVGYTPFFAADLVCKNISIVATSPSKSFNLAGLHTASLLIANERLREKVRAGLHADMIDEPNAFSVEASLAAYTESDDWLDELRAVLAVNKAFACRRLTEHCPGLKVRYPQASYLLWLDCSTLTENADDLADFLREATGLVLTKGSVFLGNGRSFLRMNVACPTPMLEDGISRFIHGWRAYAESL